MNLSEFKQSIKNNNKPQGLNSYLNAMFEDALGNWEKAHEIAQDIPDPMGSLIHAYLHRKEGDNWNANYWYSRAGREMPKMNLEQEWESICEELLS